MYNKVQLIGRLGQDPELKPTANWSVCKLNVATSETFKDKQGAIQTSTEWHRVVIFGPLANACGSNLKKGSLIFVEGKVQTRSYEKDGRKMYSTEIIGHTVKFLDKADAGTAYSGDKSQGAEPSFNSSEDIPF
jgi:single-strand DNA-binding protein